MPGPNEIVFCKENGGKPASMTWKYPQPRALTRIEIHPVPFRAASEASVRDDFEEKVLWIHFFFNSLIRRAIAKYDTVV